MKKYLRFFFVGLAAFLLASCDAQTGKGNSLTGGGTADMPFVNSDGIGDLKRGTPFLECVDECSGDWIPTLESLSSDKDLMFGFYDRTCLKTVSFAETSVYLLLYAQDELMAALDFGSGCLYGDGLASQAVRQLIVYSPKLKLGGGIHTGMSAKELVDDFGAEIKYSEGAETAILSFEVPDLPSRIKLVGTAKEINREKIDSMYEQQSDSDIYLTLDDVKDCTLTEIVIG